jgi:hypothetical protein
MNTLKNWGGRGIKAGVDMLEGISPRAASAARTGAGQVGNLWQLGKGKVGSAYEATKAWGGKGLDKAKGMLPEKGIWQGTKDLAKAGWGKVGGWFGKGAASGAAAGGAGAAGAGAAGAAANASRAFTVGKTLKAITPGAIAGIGLDYAGDKVGHENRTGALLDVGGEIATGASTGALAASVIPIPLLSTAVGGVVGGVIGAAHGIWKNWDSLKFKSSDFFGENASFTNFFMKQRKPGKVGMIRIVQYGALPTEDSKVDSFLTLERLVRDNCKISGGILTYSTGDIPAKDVLKAFNIDPQKKEDVFRFHSWFNNRFLPVFRQHIESLYKVNSKAKIDTVDDDLSPKEKIDYINAVKVIPGVLNYTASPFADGEKLSTGSAEVENAVAIAIKSVGATDGKPAVATAVTSGAAATAAKGAAKPKAATNLTDAPDGNLKDLADTNGKIGIAGSAISLVGKVPKLTSLDAVRMKTYGLVNLEADKVNAILKLEAYAEAGLSFTADKTANWSGSVPEIVDKCGGAFGVPGLNTEEGTNFMTWFTHRFVPVFSAAAGAIKIVSGKDSPTKAFKTLTDEQCLNVAMAIQTAKDSDGRSVWSIDTSPWPNYVMNTSSQSIQHTMIIMRGAVKPTMASEKTTMVDRRSDENIREAVKSGAAAKGGSGAWTVEQGMKDAAAKMNDSPSRGFWGSISHAAGSMWHDIKNTFGFGDRSQISGGVTANTDIQGTGGKIDGIKSPKGAAGYAAMKDMLDDVAKVVGVDPNLLATFAAIESGFNPTATNNSSSAGGLFQFLNRTWDLMLKQYGPKYGIGPGANKFDPRTNALMGAEYLKNNAAILKKALGRDVTQTDLYLAHFMGTTGAIKLLKSDPDAIAANLFPGPARSNPDVFFPGKQPVTIRQMYSNITALMANKSKRFGIGMKNPPATMPVAAGAKKPAENAVKGSAGSAPGVPAPAVAKTPTATPATTAKPSVTSAVTSGAATSSSDEVAKITVIGKKKSADNSSSMSSNAVAVQTAARTSNYSSPGLDNSNTSDIVKVLQTQTDILKDIRDVLSKHGIRVAQVDQMPDSQTSSVASTDTSATPAVDTANATDNSGTATGAAIRSRRAIPISMKKTA